ncbi:MAG TPA: amidohydrolase family protein [Nannocystaceae bacterium]|nr:amidohydrolase family protein [Nannocystaceae bacterium]
MSAATPILVKGGTVVTMDAQRRIALADVLLDKGRIVAIGNGLEAGEAQVIDASGLFVLPGFVQGHTHLGQALLRGLAEGRDLLRWLRERVWPLEAAHDHDSAYWSGMLGAADCLLSGTTTIQDIGIVTHMDAIFLAIEDSGLRAIAGKCLMDTGVGVPAVLAESTGASLDELRALHSRWNGEADGRIQLAVCPRFILSCSQALWEGAVALAQELDLPMHTHLLEHASEEDEVKALLGAGQLEWLDAIGVLDTRLSIAHGVQFDARHRDRLRGRALGVVHCPSANLKLGSGIADLQFLRETPGVIVGLGCDGAPCNNDMDVLEEMRLAALLQGIKAGPGRFASESALALATIEGAKAIGLGAEIGSIEPGKAADLVLLDLDRPQTFGADEVSVYDRIVYAAGREAVAWVIVDGIVRVDHGKLPHVDADALRAKPKEAIAALLQRAALQ